VLPVLFVSWKMCVCTLKVHMYVNLQPISKYDVKNATKYTAAAIS